MDARRESAEPYKEFIREMTLRIERALGSISRDFREETREHRAESRAYFEVLHAELRDLREESRAQTQALLRVLDRLDGPGSAPAT